MSSMPSALNRPVVDFWFDFASTYSYLSAMRIDDAAQDFGVAIGWKPFVLGAIFNEFGWKNSPFVLQVEKGRYMWRDMEREAEKYKVAFRRPSEFPRGSMLPSRVAVLGAEEPWGSLFCRRVFAQNFAEDVDINADETVVRALDGLVPDPEQVIASARQEPIKSRLRAQTEQARALGIFGAPTFCCEGEMFWGNDRLEDALSFACKTPRQ